MPGPASKKSASSKKVEAGKVRVSCFLVVPQLTRQTDHFFARVVLSCRDSNNNLSFLSLSGYMDGWIQFNVGDTVLCKMRGFPAWPGKVCRAFHSFFFSSSSSYPAFPPELVSSLRVLNQLNSSLSLLKLLTLSPFFHSAVRWMDGL